MKKLLLSILIVTLFLVVTGCGNKKEVPPKKENNIKQNSTSVVIYFSATGTTKAVAEKIAKASNSDIIEIVPKEEYKSEDLNYNSDCRANREQNDSNARPEIKNEIDISKYDIIYLGYPIWWGTNPKIILTLLDTYDFTGKVIIPFCTSGSSDISKSVSDLRSYNSKLNIKDGKRFSLNDSEEVIQEFISINNNDMENKQMKVIINEKEYIINLEDNATAKKLVEILPFEVTMTELNGYEKYVYLATGFPIDPYQPEHLEKGDVMLFDNACLVIFYKSVDLPFNYTKVGHIDNIDDLGNEDIVAKFIK